MKTTLAIIDLAMAEHPAAALAVSGGGDSTALLHIIFTRTKHRPRLLHVATPAEWPETLGFVRRLAKAYKARLIVTKPPWTLPELWNKKGWPMLGKAPARAWQKDHAARDFGFRVDCSTCCRLLKIKPARDAAKKAGLDMILTGQRGQVDDRIRGLRALTDGPISYNNTDHVWTANPLTGWTGNMLRRFTSAEDVPRHPRKLAGAGSIGCIYCGGSGRHTDSTFRTLRLQDPEAWRRLMVTWRAGLIVLSIKHDQPLPIVRQAVKRCGGLAALAAKRPWVFDFLTTHPKPGHPLNAGVDRQEKAE